jgi:hypothetical protein
MKVNDCQWSSECLVHSIADVLIFFLGELCYCHLANSSIWPQRNLARPNVYMCKKTALLKVGPEHLFSARCVMVHLSPFALF